MQTLALSTVILAPRDRVFDLARNVEAHLDSTEGTGERVVAGVASGLVKLNYEITWEARHLGVTQRLTVRITAFDRPNHFQDVMIAGPFQEMRHDHDFSTGADGTLMVDRFQFASPGGLAGRMADRFLAGYLRGFLVRRNQVLKQLAESDGWKRYLENV